VAGGAVCRPGELEPLGDFWSLPRCARSRSRLPLAQGDGIVPHRNPRDTSSANARLGLSLAMDKCPDIPAAWSSNPTLRVLLLPWEFSMILGGRRRSKTDRVWKAVTDVVSLVNDASWPKAVG
jgi:hypothetical protein